MIRTHALKLGYQRKEVVHGIDLQVKKGKITTIVGPNGCGKSTVLKGVSRLLSPFSGKVYLEDRPLSQVSTKTIAKKIAILPQMRTAPEDIRVTDLVAMGRFPHLGWRGKLKSEDQEAIQWALEKTNMRKFTNRRMDQLSGGESQRAWIAMALAQKTELIILDEPTTFLDLSHQLEVLELLAELNREEEISILMVLHDLNQAIRYSHQIYVMNNGCVYCQGNPNVMISENVLQKIFSVDADFFQDSRNKCNHFIPYRMEIPSEI